MGRLAGTWAACIGLCCLTTVARGAEPEGPAVVVVLDCSLRMAESLPGGEGDATRFSAARAALISAVTSTVNKEGTALGVVCLGHRLAWDEAEQPDIVEQADYLSQTAGFAAINSLLPGNDVEVLRRPLTLSAQDARFAAPILETLRPWGEAPVNRALTAAMRQFSSAGGAQQGIILITAGGEKIGQNGVRFSRQEVLETYYRRRVPMHVVAVGAASDTNDATWNDLRHFARRTHGSFQPVESSSRVQEAVRTAYDAIVQGATVPAPPRFPAVAESLPRPATATAIGDARYSDAPAGASVEGVVLCYGRPLRKAQVTVEGQSAVVTDAAGEFRLGALAPGRYAVHVVGDSHHRPYISEFTLVVPDRSAEPLFVEYDLR